MSLTQSRKTLIDAMVTAGLIKFGQFKLKSGAESKVYIDVRSVVGHPDLLRSLVYEIYYNLLPTSLFSSGIDYYDLFVGVPWGAVPLTAAISYESGKPMIVLRDKPKDYGLKNLVEARPENPMVNKCILIEDVVTTGGSISESIKTLRNEGFSVVAVIVVVDRREQPGSIEGVPIYSVLTLKDIILSRETANEILQDVFN